MKFGLMNLFSDYGNVSQEKVLWESLEEIDYAEELGFDSVWLPEHHFSVYGMLGDTLTFAAAVAQRTKRIKIGTAVVLLPLSHPVRVAEQAALVDALSQGRLLLGVGRAYQPGEFDGFGADPAQSREMFLESLEIIKKCFTEQNFSYEGRFWQVKNVTLFPKPVQKPHPPIFWAAVSTASYELAARLGYPILRAPNFTALSTVEKQWQVYCQTLEESGHDASQMDQPLMAQTYVAETEEEARRDAGPHAMWYWKLLGSLLPGAPGKRVEKGYEIYPKFQEKMAELRQEDLFDWGTCYGTPDQVIERIKLYLERAGTNHWLAWMRFGGLEHKKVMRSMELFAKYVMPAFREEAVTVT